MEEKDLLIYEDELVSAFLEQEGLTYGHITLIPKEHLPIFENYDEKTVSHLFNISNKLSSILFETLNIQGTNLIINNGVSAGQKYPHLTLHIIPRKDGDGLNLEWAPKQLSDDEMSTAEIKLKEFTKNIGIEKKVKTETAKEKEKEVINAEIKENYLIKHLRRIP